MSTLYTIKSIYKNAGIHIITAPPLIIIVVQYDLKYLKFIHIMHSRSIHFDPSLYLILKQKKMNCIIGTVTCKMTAP